MQLDKDGKYFQQWPSDIFHSSQQWSSKSDYWEAGSCTRVGFSFFSWSCVFLSLMCGRGSAAAGVLTKAEVRAPPGPRPVASITTWPICSCPCATWPEDAPRKRTVSDKLFFSPYTNTSAILFRTWRYQDGAGATKEAFLMGVALSAWSHQALGAGPQLCRLRSVIPSAWFLTNWGCAGGCIRFTRGFEQLETSSLGTSLVVKVLSVLSMREVQAQPRARSWDTAFYVVQPPKLIKIHSHKCPSRMIIENGDPRVRPLGVTSLT